MSKQVKIKFPLWAVGVLFLSLLLFGLFVPVLAGGWWNDPCYQESAEYETLWGWIAPLGENWNKPTTYFSVVVSSSESKFYMINYRAQTPIFIWFMTMPIILLAIYHYNEPMSKFIIAWIAGNFMPWFIWEIQKKNMPFNHYFLLTIPAIVIGIPWFWDKVGGKYKHHAMIIHLICVMVYFFIFFPVGLVRTLS